MKISYDIETDALYIRLLEGKYECRTLRINDTVALNIGLNESLVGIEILDAQHVFGKNEIPSLCIENMQVAQAA